MFRKLIPAFVAMIALSATTSAFAEKLEVGDDAPKFALKGDDGKMVKLSDFKGKTLVVTFNRANWCPFCMKQVSELQKNYDDIKEEGAELLTIFREESEGEEGLKQIRKTTGAKFPFALDLNSEKTKVYSTEGFDTYVINKEGKIAAVIDGTKKDRPMSKQIIQALRKK